MTEEIRDGSVGGDGGDRSPSSASSASSPPRSKTKQPRSSSSAPSSARSLQDQPSDAGAAAAAQAAMGLRGKDRRRRGRADDGEAKEEGALVTTGSSLRDDPDQEEDEERGNHKEREDTFWRSRGMVLFVVFMALLLDETLMTVIVPIVPDYLLNHCLAEKCSEVNVSTPDCASLMSSPADDIGTTSKTWRQTESLLAITTPPSAVVSRHGHVVTATPTMGRASTERTPVESVIRTRGLGAFTSSLPSVMTKIVGTSSRMAADLSPSGIDSTPSTPPSIEDLCMEEVVPKAGILFASKFIVRIVLSPFVGTFAHKIGFSMLLLSGCAIMIVSSVVFAFGVSYEALLAARIIHGMGATLNEIGGLGLIAYEYRNDEKRRGFALGLAIGGFATGTLIGPPLGGICYDFLGKESPFLVMIGFFVALGVLELVALNPGSKQHQVITKGRPVYKLILDPYILAAAGALMIASGVIALLEPTLPIWMRHNIFPPPGAWQLGAVFLPSGLSYIVSSTVMGYLGYKFGRWSLSMIALVVLAVSVAAVPYTSTFLELVGPMVGTGFGFGTVDSTMTAMLNSRVDARHKGAYGGAAAISTFAFCLGFAIGPSVSGFLTNAIGFKWLMRGIGVITLMYAPICIALRRPGNSNGVNARNNNVYAPGVESDVMGEGESIPVPSISRRLSRV